MLRSVDRSLHLAPPPYSSQHYVHAPTLRPNRVVGHREAQLEAGRAAHAIAAGEAVIGQPAPLPDVQDLVDGVGDHLLVEGLEHGAADARAHQARVAQHVDPLGAVEDPAAADGAVDGALATACWAMGAAAAAAEGATS